MTGRTRQIALLALTGLMLYTNLVSGAGGGFSDAPSDPGVYFLYPTGFSPAPFTFAIWFPIFLGTLVLAVWQALPAQRNAPLLDRIALPYGAALLANALTPFVTLGASNIVVLVLFLALAIAYARTLGHVRDRATRAFVQAPLAVFATWAALATVLNACQLVVARGGEVGTTTASVLVLAVMLAGVAAIRRTREGLIAAVMVWAGIGIAAANPQAMLLLGTIALTSLATVGIALTRRNVW